MPVQARLLLDLLPALALGLLLQRRWPRLAERLAPPLVQRGVPLGIAGLLLRAGLQSRFAGAGLLALLACGGGCCCCTPSRPCGGGCPWAACGWGR